MSDFITVNSTVFDSWFETIEGKDLVNIKRLAQAFDKTEDHCIEIVLKSRDLFKEEHFEFTRQNRVNSDSAPIEKRKRGRPQKDHYLTRDGCLAFLNRLDYNRYDPVISNFIIEFQKWIVRTAGQVIDKKLVPVATSQLNYIEERIGASDRHNLLMAAVKQFEAPKYPNKSREPYQRESRAVNIDVTGVHIHDTNNLLNSVGLHIKNEAYDARRVLIFAGVDYEHRNVVVRQYLDATYPNREIEDMLLTVEQKARISRKCPASQRGIGDFTAVA